MLGVSLFFFFQAEDGIRDPLVTGVQTCALPISILLADVGRERLAAGEAMRALGHGGARGVEVGQRESVEPAEEIRHWALGQLLAELIVGDPRGVAGPPLKPVGPGIVRRAVPAVR